MPATIKFGPQYIQIDKDKKRQLVDALSNNSVNSRTVQELLIQFNSASTSGKKLIDIDSRLDEFGNTLLHLAIQQQDFNFLQVLLLKGANPNVCNLGGCSPLKLAKLMEFKSAYNCLLRHGALEWLDDKQSQFERADNILCLADQKLSLLMVNEKRKQSGGSASSLGTVRIREPSYYGSDVTNGAFIGLSQFSRVIETGNMDIDTSDAYGQTSLMKAANKGQLKVVAYLMQKGADSLELTDIHGYNALVWACLGGHVESVAYIIQMAQQKVGSSVLIQHLNKEYGKVNNSGSCSLTPIIAATYSNCLKLVQFLLQIGCNPQQKAGNLDALNVAMLIGAGDIAKEIIRISGQSKVSITAQQLNTIVLNFVGLSDRSLQSTGALQADSPFQSLFQQIKSGTDDEDYKEVGKQLNTLSLFSAGSATCKPLVAPLIDEVSQLLDFKVAGEYSDVCTVIVKMFHPVGSILNRQLYLHLKEVLSLIKASNEANKAEYVVISGKAVSEGSELIRQIETWLDKKDLDEKGKVQYSLFKSTCLHIKIRELCKQLRNDHLKQMLLSTRIAVGAWPPVDAVKNMIQSALAVSQCSFKLVGLCNASGHWPIQSFNLSEYKVTGEVQAQPPIKNMNTENKVRGMSYSDYQRQAESKILDQIVAQKTVNSPTQVSTDSRSMPVPPTSPLPAIGATQNPQDQAFFSSIDNWVRQFVQCVQKLKAAKDQDLKSEYVVHASAAYTKCDGLIDEVRPYYLFRDVSMSFIVNPEVSRTPFQIMLRDFQTSILMLSDQIILNAKLASGIWPPQNAATDMLMSTKPVIEKVKELVSYVKLACNIIRQTESEERTKMESFMKDWVQNQNVRNLFNQWEKLALASLKSDEDLTQQELSEYEKKLLEDSEDGLLFEVKDGKSIIKGGKLPKLVDRLVDHNLPDNEYRNIFLLNFSSFTSAVDLLDLLIKRYDISPTYGLDQRSFEIYVNKKIVPIRLRILNLLKIWANKYPQDFLRSKDFLDKSIAFVESKICLDFGEAASQLLDLLRNGLSSLKPQRVILNESTLVNPPKPLLPKNVSLSDVGSILNSGQFGFLELDPIEIARQLTLLDSAALSEVQPKELINLAWEKKDKSVMSPNVTKMIRNTNDLTFWVVTLIVTTADIKTRVQIIKYVIQIAQACLELNNFNSLTSIVAALSQGPVYRMSKTWKLFRKQYSKISDMYNELSEIVSAKGQYAQYRAKLKASQPPLVPFLGVLLTDLSFVDLGNPDYLPESNFINYEKRRKTSNIIDDMLKYQQYRFNIVEVPAISEMVKNLGANGWLDEKAFYEKSLASEPREEENSDDDTN
ncbi:hypothetical protein MIR68_005148 [Amoeboaphelidium protococcarum]|nr:hypothetical protein MIR68_005148 [Amoeboaphelidium protococcarum]